MEQLSSSEQLSSLSTRKSRHFWPNGPFQMLEMPTSMAHSSAYKVQSVETLETLVVMKTCFIREHIHIGIHYIMYQASKLLVDI